MQEFPRAITIYKGENRFLVIPNDKHIGHYYLESSLGIKLNLDEQEKLIESIVASMEYIKKTPLSTVTPEEHDPAWRHNTQYKSWNSFWKNNIHGIINKYADGSYKLCSRKRASTPSQAYHGCIKIIDLPAGSTYEEVAAAVLDVFAAADEYYATHGAPDPYPRKEVELLDNTVLSFRPPCDRHFEDAGDFGVGEIYQGYSYLPREDAEPSAEFFLGIAPEIDCNLEPGNVKECWERTYGTAEDFKMQEVSKGIYTHYAEMKNKSVYKTSYFLQHGDDLILECGMMLHMPNRRKKLEEKLIPLFEEFAANCKRND